MMNILSFCPLCPIVVSVALQVYSDDRKDVVSIWNVDWPMLLNGQVVTFLGPFLR